MKNPTDENEMEHPDYNEDCFLQENWPEWEGPEPDYGRDWYEI